jgi:hypothetical protein
MGILEIKIKKKKADLSTRAEIRRGEGEGRERKERTTGTCLDLKIDGVGSRPRWCVYLLGR